MIEIPISRPKDDLDSNVKLIEYLLKEIKLTSNWFDVRKSKLVEFEKQRIENLEKLGVEAPQIKYVNQSNHNSDVELTVHFKSFLFILRQSIEKVFRVIYQFRVNLGYVNVQREIPDLSRAGAFAKKFKGILDKNYDYDPEILDEINKWSDIFIISRLLRNALKTQATFQTHYLFVKGRIVVTIICPLMKDQLTDKSFNLIKSKKYENLDKLKIIKIENSFIHDSIKLLESFLALITMKLT